MADTVLKNLLMQYDQKRFKAEHDADEALYYSKEHGRNQITYYNDLRLRDMQVNR